jgi:hypothetical protein
MQDTEVVDSLLTWEQLTKGSKEEVERQKRITLANKVCFSLLPIIKS